MNIRQTVTSLWAANLGVDLPSPDISFFTLGGDSLTAVRVLLGINAALHCNLTYYEFNLFDSIDKLCTFLESHPERMSADSFALNTRISGKSAPLAPSQQLMFLFHHHYTDSVAYNVQAILRIEGPLDIGRLQASLSDLIARQPIFRTTFHMTPEHPEQIISDAYIPELTFEDDEDCSTQSIQQKLHDFVQPFKLDILPLFRIKLIRHTPKSYTLFFDMHHILMDEGSLVLFTKQWVELYLGSDAPSPSLTFHDLIPWLNDRLSSSELAAQKQFWINKLSPAPLPVSLPLDYLRPSVFDFKGQTLSTTLPKETYTNLQRLSAKYNSTLFMLLLSTLFVLVHKYSQSTDIVIGTPFINRPHPEMSQMLGLFINYLPIRLNILATDDWSHILEKTKNGLIEAMDNQECLFDQLITDLHLNTEEQISFRQLLFILEKPGFANETFSNLQLTSISPLSHSAKMELSLLAQPKNDTLELRLEYATSLFKPETMQQFLSRYCSLLDQVIETLE